MPDMKFKLSKKNESQVEKLFFELSLLSIATMIILHSVSFFFGLTEKYFLHKLFILIVLSVICLVIEYFTVFKSASDEKIKRYVLSVSLWCFMSVSIMLFSVMTPYLLMFIAVLSMTSLFRDSHVNILELILCILTTLSVCAKYAVTTNEAQFYEYMIILSSIVYEIMIYFIVCIFQKQNELFLYEMVTRLDSQKKDISELNHEIIDIQETVILSVAEIIEAKSPQTGQHVKRVSEYVKLLCAELGYPKDEIERIRIASMLHDIGKLSVPAEIIEKKGKYTPEEYEIMKTHVTEGEKILSKTPGYTMGLARIIALQHHERWDGSGYLGLKGNQIDKISRIVAVADVFDALVSSRSYKKSWPPEKVYEYIVSESGTHFDPWVVDSFKKCYNKMVKTLHQFPENVFDE